MRNSLLRYKGALLLDGSTFRPSIASQETSWGVWDCNRTFVTCKF
jgi:hypothetical protein